MNTKDEIRLRLIDLMDSQGISGRDLAEAVGVSKQAVSAWRTGKSSIDIENVLAICNFLNVTVDDFFGADAKQDKTTLTADELELIGMYRLMTEKHRATVLDVVRAICENDSE